VLRTLLCVSPTEIEQVRRTWSRAMQAPDRFEAAVAERLDGPPPRRRSQARWIVASVSRLSHVLDHPTRFATEAEAELARRSPVTIDELAVERDALMTTLRAEVGELGPARERAWALAFGLFEEIVVERCLDPFGCRDLGGLTPEDQR
jgi:hypothetical protein